jgi:acetylornithine deacetylase
MALHLALSFDEVPGCVGAGSPAGTLAQAPHWPVQCIVGESTGMAVTTGHKGEMALRATCPGHEAHSAPAPLGLKAIHLRGRPGETSPNASGLAGAGEIARR